MEGSGSLADRKIVAIVVPCVERFNPVSDQHRKFRAKRPSTLLSLQETDRFILLPKKV
jgi:hypothetical protein